MRRALLLIALGVPALAPRLALAASRAPVSDVTHDEDMGSSDSNGGGSDDSSSSSSSDTSSEPTNHGFIDPDTPYSGGGSSDSSSSSSSSE